MAQNGQIDNIIQYVLFLLINCTILLFIFGLSIIYFLLWYEPATFSYFPKPLNSLSVPVRNYGAQKKIIAADLLAVVPV